MARAAKKPMNPGVSTHVLHLRSHLRDVDGWGTSTYVQFSHRELFCAYTAPSTTELKRQTRREARAQSQRSRRDSSAASRCHGGLSCFHIRCYAYHEPPR